ncbi:MAG: P-loop NTPase [Acutalibacteraceae bacterium]
MAQKILIASGKGGVGKTSCAVGIGRALTQTMGRSVLLVDGDVGLRSLDVLLGVSDRIVYDWGDVIFDRCLPAAAVVPCGGVDLLTCPLQFDSAFTPESMRRMINFYDKDYDFIIIDAPAGIDAGFMLSASVADRALIVSTADRVCVRSAQRAGEKLEEAGIEDIRLIINRFRKRSVSAKKLLNIDAVIDETMIQLIGVVPEDEDITFGRVSEKKSQISYQPFVRISRRILRQEVPLSLSF